MHRRTRSGNFTPHHTLQELLRNGAARTLSGPTASTSTTPSRFRAEADVEHLQHANVPPASTAASASLSHSSKGISNDDHIICESKLYDAYELQDLEQHLDRELTLDQGSKTRSDSAVRAGQEAQKPLLSSASNVNTNGVNDHRSSTDFVRDVRKRCPCTYCKSRYAKNSSLSSRNSSRQSGAHRVSSLNSRRTPSVDSHRMPSLSSVSNIEIQPGAEEPSVSSRRVRAAEMSDPVPPSLSMPHGFVYRGASAEPNDLALQEQETSRTHALRHPIKALRTHRPLRRRRNHRVPCFCRPLRKKKQNNKFITNGDALSPSASMNGYGEPGNREFHHHHTVNHYHEVHHHHHHHLDNGPRIEQIEWPSSPARLEDPS